MALRFIGVDPNTRQGESPAVWVDDDKRELVIRGYRPDEQLLQQIHDNPPPDYAASIPAHGTRSVSRSA
ncbi:hypothetical protein [Streptacidiphilus rugosus]|uniref:hypothetical protein n=1 Tax=Streptacidiphilus rugosus TaxID=405783 RepID=UPI000A5A1637|nr:hypothetical protein [Streptacidiphilus rugosus]